MRIRLWPRSIQNRLLLAFFIGSMLVTMGAGALAFQLLGNYARQEFDASLADKLRFYKSTVYFTENSALRYKMGAADWERVTDPSDPDYFEIKNVFGRTIGRPFHNPNLKLPPVGLNSAKPQYSDFTLKDGTPVRVIGSLLEIDYTPAWSLVPKKATVCVVVAKGTASISTTLGKLQSLIIRTGLIGVGSLLITAFFIIRRGVRPVGILERQISALPVSEKGARFSLPKAPSEVSTVVNRLNELMNRVDEALEHERQFTSNAAHELRTPLAGMRAQIDLALSRTRTPSEYEDTLFKLKDMQQKLQQLTDNLLLMAKLESGQREFSTESLTLKQFINRAWKPYFDAAAERELAFSMKVTGSDAPASLPTALLDIILRNLFQNALDYAPAGGILEIRGHWEKEARQCRISVANTNPGVDPANLERLFQPFWRADQSGDPNIKNAGIGLALCRRIMGILDGQITAEITPEGLFRIQVELPVAEASSSPAS